MQIDPETAINALIKQGIMLKAAPNTIFRTSKSHCIILLNKNPHQDEYFTFVSASAQFVRRVDFAARRNLPATTVVMIRGGIYYHLPKYTAIDCNYIHTLTRGEVVALYSESRLSFYRESSVLKPTDLKKVISGVIDSPLVLEEIKKLII